MTYRKSKRAISFMLVMAMLMTLLVGTTAWFTDRVSTSASGTAGTVTINLDDSGINLKDSAGKDILNPGDMRNVSYVVSNTGNKSVDIKETIYLSAYDKLGQALNLSDTQSEFEIYNASDVSFVDNRGYLPNDGAEPLQVKSLSENVITYEIPVYALNGSTNFDDSNREIEDDITTDKHSSDYVLVFKNLAGNAFQGAVLKLDLMVEAKQHRNTENVLWTEVATKTHVLSNGNTVYIVPGAGVVINPSEDFEVEDLGNGNIKISGLTDIGANKETLVIPSTIVDGESGNTYTVTDVDWEQVFADSNNTKINNSAVGLPQPSDNLVFDMTSDGNTTTINGINANGQKLTNISIPEQVGGEDVEISDEMVEDLGNTDADVEIPDSVIENLPATAIYTYTVEGETTTITGLTDMGRKVNTLDIPSEMAGSTVIKIAPYALVATTATEVIIPASIEVADSAFADFNISTGVNTSIKTVTLNNSVIGKNMFMGASALETVNINSGVDSIGGAAFLECRNLKNINFDEGITSIGERAFDGCTSLTSLTLPSSLTTLNNQAFAGTGITSIVVPATITTVGANVFDNCDSLTSITLENTAIGGGMFQDCDALESIVIPANITTVGYRAFANCDNLTDITIENNYIGRQQFYNCDALTEITIPASVTTYDTDYMRYNGAFSGCDGLTTVHFEDGAKVGTSMFENCTSLNNVVIPETVEVLEGYYGAKTFANCTGLTNVTLNNSAVVSQMFVGCENLETITLGDNVKSIGGNAFNGCAKLKSIDLNKVETLANGAFYNSGLEGTLVFPETVTSIGKNVLQGTKVTEIYIPENVTTIDAAAFDYCDGLTIHYAGALTGSPWGATNSTVVAD